MNVILPQRAFMSRANNHAEIMMLQECYADLRLHIIPLNVLYPSSSL